MPGAAQAARQARHGDPAADGDVPRRPDLLTCVRVITQSPALTLGVNRMLDSQRTALARVLAAESAAGDADIRRISRQPEICAVISAIKSRFFGLLAAGESAEQAAARLPGYVELAFDLLSRGIGDP